ncbi:MAG: 5'-methylthioadenosine/S-adenosylhomocysteine nucleosidase [Elusimicrobiales bacterium]|nr:5'-methylthioadenosine/S-adenosylhomocysteine nucleosidase [Elusimicrobiales bacterium]
MKICIQICSGFEWRAVKKIFAVKATAVKTHSLGEYFAGAIANRKCIVFHSGATKTRAAAACQHAIDKWNPDAIAVLGTCGGISPELEIFDVVLADKTVQYDCLDFITGAKDTFYAPMVTELDNSWINHAGVRGKATVGTIGTGDRDLDFKTAAALRKENILAADWESGAVAKVCEINRRQCLILRGITDKPVNHKKADRAKQTDDYKRNTPLVMKKLLALLPELLSGGNYLM